MEKTKIIELLLQVITIVCKKDTKITIVEAKELIIIRKDLKALGIDLNKYLG